MGGPRPRATADNNDNCILSLSSAAETHFKVGAALGKDTEGIKAGVQSVRCSMGSAACGHPDPGSISPTASQARPKSWPIPEGRPESVRWLGNDLVVIITSVYFIHILRKKNYLIKTSILHILSLGNEMKHIQILKLNYFTKNKKQ